MYKLFLHRFPKVSGIGFVEIELLGQTARKRADPFASCARASSISPAILALVCSSSEAASLRAASRPCGGWAAEAHFPFVGRDQKRSHSDRKRDCAPAAAAKIA